MNCNEIEESSYEWAEIYFFIEDNMQDRQDLIPPVMHHGSKYSGEYGSLRYPILWRVEYREMCGDSI